jgi:hypothetical protein
MMIGVSTRHVIFRKGYQISLSTYVGIYTTFSPILICHALRDGIRYKKPNLAAKWSPDEILLQNTSILPLEILSVLRVEFEAHQTPLAT